VTQALLEVKPWLAALPAPLPRIWTAVAGLRARGLLESCCADAEGSPGLLITLAVNTGSHCDACLYRRVHKVLHCL
jgi:hypothetical protein